MMVLMKGELHLQNTRSILKEIFICTGEDCDHWLNLYGMDAFCEKNKGN